MESRFSLYDVLAVMVPGTVLAVVAALAVHAITGVDFGVGSANALTATATVLVIYFVGCVVQSAGRRLERKRLFPALNDLPSVWVIQSTGSPLSAGLRDAIRSEIKAAFPQLVVPDGVDDLVEGRHQQELFRVCQAYVDECCSTTRPDSFLASYGMARGLIVACEWSAAVAAVGWIALLVSEWGSWAVLAENPSLVLVILAFASLVCRQVFKQLAVSRATDFAKAVYLAFYVHRVAERSNDA